MKRHEFLKELNDLRMKHGKSFSKKFRIRKNYPFGKNSRPIYTIERK